MANYHGRTLIFDQNWVSRNSCDTKRYGRYTQNVIYIGETGRQLRTRFGEHRRAVSANDSNQPVARHFNSGSHCISDMKIRALCPISGSKDSCKKQEMRLISKLGTEHPIGINERFTLKTGYLNKALPVILGQSCLPSVDGYGYFYLFILSCNIVLSLQRALSWLS